MSCSFTAASKLTSLLKKTFILFSFDSSKQLVDISMSCFAPQSRLMTNGYWVELNLKGLGIRDSKDLSDMSYPNIFHDENAFTLEELKTYESHGVYDQFG